MLQPDLLSQHTEFYAQIRLQRQVRSLANDSGPRMVPNAARFRRVARYTNENSADSGPLKIRIEF